MQLVYDFQIAAYCFYFYSHLFNFKCRVSLNVTTCDLLFTTKSLMMEVFTWYVRQAKTCVTHSCLVVFICLLHPTPQTQLTDSFKEAPENQEQSQSVTPAQQPLPPLWLTPQTGETVSWDGRVGTYRQTVETKKKKAGFACAFRTASALPQICMQVLRHYVKPPALTGIKNVWLLVKSSPMITFDVGGCREHV